MIINNGALTSIVLQQKKSKISNKTFTVQITTHATHAIISLIAIASAQNACIQRGPVCIPLTVQAQVALVWLQAFRASILGLICDVAKELAIARRLVQSTRTLSTECLEIDIIAFGHRCRIEVNKNRQTVGVVGQESSQFNDLVRGLDCRIDAQYFRCPIVEYNRYGFNCTIHIVCLVTVDQIIFEAYCRLGTVKQTY
jgi:hypothetical protein